MEKLTEELIQLLQGEKIVSLITVDSESQNPHLSVVSWVLANPTGEQIHIAVGNKASVIPNIEQNPNVILGVIGAGSCYAIKGKVSQTNSFAKTMKFQTFTVDVTSVEDVMFYGGKISVEPEYVKTYNKELAEKLDAEIYGTLESLFNLHTN
ncbi:pyridoxamine 5'-phosphate oxidase family protein [Schinkia sp. CFF1]